VRGEALDAVEGRRTVGELPNIWLAWDILFAVAEFLGTGSQVPLLLVIDAI
jgi:hypothetical protein